MRQNNQKVRVHRMGARKRTCWYIELPHRAVDAAFAENVLKQMRAETVANGLRLSAAFFLADDQRHRARNFSLPAAGRLAADSLAGIV